MATKIQFKITNVKFNETKNIENNLKSLFPNLYKNFYNQKDKRGNISVFFITKNNDILITDILSFFNKTSWKCSYIEL